MTELMKCTSEWLLNKYSFLFKSIVQVYSVKDNNNIGSGTGFFIQKDERIFLCTNKHVISINDDVLNGNDKIEFIDELKIQINLKNGETVILSLPISDSSGQILESIQLHPTSFVDIAIIDITLSNLNQLLKYTDILLFSHKSLLTADRESELAVGNKAYVLGYPQGYSFTAKKYPVASESVIKEINSSPFNFSGSISAAQELFVDNHFITLSGELYRGMSGAPIIILCDEQNQLVDRNYLIVGICAFFNDDNSKVDAYKSESILQLIHS
jgi:hypothetical protein